MVSVGYPSAVRCHCGGSIEIIAPPEVTYKSKSIMQAPIGVNRKELKFSFPAICNADFSHKLWVELIEFNDEVTIQLTQREEHVSPMLAKYWPKAMEVEAVKAALEWEDK